MRVTHRRTAIALMLSLVAVCHADYVPDSSKVRHPAALHVLLDNSGDRNRTQEELIASVAGVMALDEAGVAALVSRDNGFASVRCPVCNGYVSRFDLSDPDHVYCTQCEAAFPDPNKYPETYPHTGRNISGEPVEWHYYAKDGKGYEYFFTAVLRNARHTYLEAKAGDLGRLYNMTGDERYARRGALISVLLAEAYPHWCARYDHAWYGRYIVSERPWKGGVFAGGHWHGEMPFACLMAYDFTYNSKVWDELAAERGTDARKSVEDWFRWAYRIMVENHEDAGGGVGNLHPYGMRKMIAAGLVLGDPDMIHAVIPWATKLAQDHFYFDGMWREGTPDYHGQTIWNLGRALNAAKGYTDPEGYVDTTHGIVLQDADLMAEYAMLAKADRVLSGAVYPDGRRVTIHDTHWRPESGEIKQIPNIELNAYGHFSLTRGEGLDMVQAHLHFCPLTSHGHFHQDRLSMILWAAGGEALPDLGYATDSACYRYFATGSLSHNMAYVGFAEPPKQPEREFAQGELDTNIWARSSLLAYDPGEQCGKRVQLVEAESPGPEWMAVDTARRLLVMVAADEKRSYVVDLFRLRGGDYHEWILRPSADEDSDQECSIPLTPRPGTLAGEQIEYGQSAPGQGYRNLIHDLEVGDGAQDCAVTWRTQSVKRSVRGYLKGDPGSELLLGRAPIIRPTANKPAERDKYHAPYLMRRHEGDEDLTSCFGAIYDAWANGGAPVIDSVQWLQPIPADEFCAAVRVRIGDREQIIYSSVDDQPRTVDGITMQGHVAVLSRVGNRVEWGYVYGPGLIRAGALSVTGAALVRAALGAVERAADGGDNALVVKQALDAEGLSGTWLRVIHGDGSAHGYRIERTEQAEGGTRIVIHDEPGFAVVDRGMKMLFFPHYMIPGEQVVEIERAVWVEGEG